MQSIEQYAEDLHVEHMTGAVLSQTTHVSELMASQYLFVDLLVSIGRMEEQLMNLQSSILDARQSG